MNDKTVTDSTGAVEPPVWFDPSLLNMSSWGLMGWAEKQGLDGELVIGTVRAIRTGTPLSPQPSQPPSGNLMPFLAARGGGTAPTYEPLEYPPGLAGELAYFIHETSYLKVPEVAIAATLGLLAGVCGRAFETYSGKDLSLYIILVAQSGIGKDGIHEGIPRLIKLSEIPAADYFVRAVDFSSGPALHKEILKRPGFLSLQGEFGRKLKGMANLNNTPLQELRTTMTKVYAKDFLEGKIYSDAEKSLEGVKWPALSFLGETTPDTFAESLTPDMMEDGFMSRFLVVTYKGLRPPPDRERIQYQLEPEHLERWKGLVTRALPYRVKAEDNFTTPSVRIPVGFCNDEAYEQLYQFELECGDHINASQDEYARQVWNRAHLKALKICSLLAVADNYAIPIIYPHHIDWAIMLVNRDIAMFTEQKKNGDIGAGDDTCMKKILSLARKYIVEPPAPSYKITTLFWMENEGVIPRSYFQLQVSKTKAFTNHKFGATKALDETLRSLCDSGYLMEIDRHKAVQLYGEHGRCFRVLKLD